ncbi:MAG: restriction endonuclease subunit S [Halothece sp. Uz-M2-17]|nr:restriction endonuclease subunit S [Halothece sp. Uz-M2-17]
MDLKMLWDNFDVIAEAENGIQRLRDLILDLAIRGKLVPQYDSEEPPSLENIQEELKALNNNGRKRQQIKTLSKLDESEIPFDKPNNWEWCRLGEIIRVSSGNYLPSSKMDKSGKIPVYGGNGVTGYHSDSNIFQKTLIIGRVGYYCGSVHITPNSAWITDNAFITYFPDNHIDMNFLYWLLKVIDLQQNNSATAQPVISGRKIYPIPIALPPLKEQQRIVKKVDELMELCDRAQASKNNRNELQQQLRRSAIHALETAETEEDFKKSWHFVRDNWRNFSQRTEDIDSLRQQVLILAFKGKLTTQELSDRSVFKELEKLEVDIQKTITKKRKQNKAINNDDIPYQLPNSWTWIRLSQITELITKGSSPKWQGVNYVEDDSGVLFITSENVRNFYIDISSPKFVEQKFNEIQPRSILKKNDLLINIVGASIGRTALFDLDVVTNINQAVCLIRFFDSIPIIDHRYALYFFNSLICVNFMFENQVDSARANLSMGNISNFLIPLPPLEEQKRIVSKVDELMKSCDRVEESLSKKEELASAISASVIHHLEL